MNNKFPALVLPALREILRICVSGAGTMSPGWVIFLFVGFLKLFKGEVLPDIYIYDPDPIARENAKARILNGIKKAVSKAKVIPNALELVTEKLHFVKEQAGLYVGPQFYIEIVDENLPLKKRILSEIGCNMPPNCIMASNTSCLPPDELAEACGFPERFIILHGMNSVERTKLMEIAKPTKLNPIVLTYCQDMMHQFGKRTIVAKNVSGFFINRYYVPWFLDIFGALVRGEVSIADGDMALFDGLGLPMGGYYLADVIGLRVMILVADLQYAHSEEARKERNFVPPELRKIAENGWEGRKTGHGLYNWTGDGDPVPYDFDFLLNNKAPAGAVA